MKLRPSVRDLFPKATGEVVRHAVVRVGASQRLLHRVPWATIVESQETQGEYRWQPDRSVPATVFMRVEVSDAAGNIGHAVTEKEIVVTASRVVGKLRAVKSIAPAANAGP